MHIYDQLWNEAIPAFERGEPQLDPFLPDKSKDKRRGLSLAFWPSESVRQNIQTFLQQLAAEFTGQYFYQPEELHVTVLTLISGSELWQREMGDVPAFRTLLGEILRRHAPFKIEFRGVTAAPNAVLIQGFPLDDGLPKIREEVRRSFAQNGLADRLDRRYANSAAHITAVRFCQSRANWRRLANVLKENRQTYFGEMPVEKLKLVFGDWYASADIVKTFDEYHLPGANSFRPS